MINIFKLKEFQDILNSWIDIDSSEIWDNKLLETEIINWFHHSLYDLAWKKFKFNDKPINIYINSINIKWRISKNHSIPLKHEYELINNFINLKEKDFTHDNFLYYNLWWNYKKILASDFKNKFIDFIYFCPYCWKKELEDWDLELDHYFPRALFPEFTYSLYNIIPTCHSCNTSVFKGDKYFSNNWLYFHVYLGILSYSQWFVKKLDIEKDIDDSIYFNHNNLETSNSKLDFWEKKLDWIKEHIDFFSLEAKYKKSRTVHEELEEFKHKRNWILDRISLYITKRDKIKFIKDYLSNNWTKNWPFEKKKLLISRNWKLRKDLYTWFIKDCEKNNKI